MTDTVKKRILLDMTDFSNWHGHFTGIQRVIHEIGSRLATDDTFDVQCFFYNEGTKKFYYTSNEVLFYKEELSDETDSPRVKKLPFELVARKTLNGAPRPLAEIMKKTYHFSRHHGGVFYNSQAKPLYHYLTTVKVPKNADQVEFKPEDTVLILGAGWYKRTMADRLAAEKSKYNFSVAVLIHDVIPLIKPEFFGIGLPEVYAQFMFETMCMADTVFAISQSTHKDIEDFCSEYSIITPSIITIREGDSFKQTRQPLRPRELMNVDNYVLAVASFEIRKNYQVLYQAVKQSQLDNVSLPLIVIVGRKGWLTEDLTFLLENDLTVRDKIIHLSNVNDSELEWLYSNALFTVYPSIYEGWGLPIAEALYHKKFCIASSTSSMPEVGGDLVEYVSPYDPIAWMKRIAYYFQYKTELRKREERVANEYVPTSWDETAKALKKSL